MQWMEVHRKDPTRRFGRRFPRNNIRTIAETRGMTFFEGYPGFIAACRR